ncbi:hypothetical protein CRG98_003386 [Punica granatum]|uniref:Uncharacterized protein n=1 Tax=Punica granatum TaxID=22663 RepID=A0A2I0L6D0_PUNGR|nr:hypothetical protein CRG98_003386 [Punica granatum]
MEAPSEKQEQPMQVARKKGGLRTMPFIIGNYYVMVYGLLPGREASWLRYIKGTLPTLHDGSKDAPLLLVHCHVHRAGGIRPCSIAFGADQLDNHENPKNQLVLQSFFNRYYASVGITVMLSVTVIVYIQDKAGWVIGFEVPLVLMFLAAVLFLIGSPFYVKSQRAEPEAEDGDRGLGKSLIVTAVDGVTKRGGNMSWVDSNVNKGHYDYCYWALASMSLINFLYSLVCSWAYGSCEESNIWSDEDRDANEEETDRKHNGTPTLSHV